MSSEPNDIFAVDEQLLAILQLPNRIFANRLKSTLDIIHLDAVLEFGQLLDNISNFVDHQIGSKITVDLIDRVKVGDAGTNPLQNSICGAHQRGRTFIASFNQRHPT